jgi:hypothetical protein
VAPRRGCSSILSSSLANDTTDPDPARSFSELEFHRFGPSPLSDPRESILLLRRTGAASSIALAVRKLPSSVDALDLLRRTERMLRSIKLLADALDLLRRTVSDWPRKLRSVRLLLLPTSDDARRCNMRFVGISPIGGETVAFRRAIPAAAAARWFG